MSTLVASVARVRRDILLLFGLFAVLYFVQGITETATGLVHQPTLSLLKGWGHTAAEVTTFTALLGIPWCLKPIFGLLSDFVPLAGQRRKSYFLLAGALASIFFLSLYLLPLASGAKYGLLVGLLVPTLAVTFGDVVLDALVIEIGQPRGLTSRLQSVRWGASYVAMILTGWLGGELCQHRQQRLAFLICGGLAAAASLLAFRLVSEPAKVVVEGDWPSIRRSLSAALRSKTSLIVGAFLFAWHFNPFSTSVLYLHMTKTMRLSEQFVGDTYSLLAIGSIAACVAYGIYCRRVSMRVLLPLAVLSGVASTLAYLFLEGRTSAAVISLVVGFTYMTANMIQCDLAARACPMHAAGTMFAIFMSLCNVSTLVSMWVGGSLYEAAAGYWGSADAFNAVIWLGAGMTLLSWPIVRWLPREVL